MVCFSLCVNDCVCCVLCLMSLQAVCEISCDDVWFSMCVCVCVSFLWLCGVFANYCAMLCGTCVLCDVWVCALCAVVA